MPLHGLLEQDGRFIRLRCVANYGLQRVRLLSQANTLLGIILSISILVAAGLALYDHPQVREWIDQSRQKIALAFNGIDDDPRHRRRDSTHTEDASTREDSSSEAAERRRRAREEIMQRGLVMERRRRAKSGHTSRSSSTFDDMVDSGGKLRGEEKDMDLQGVAAVVASAAEKAPIDEGLRKRIIEATGVARGSAAADPFSDEMGMGIMDEKAALEQEQLEQTRERSATLRGDSPLIIDTNVADTAQRGDDLISDHDSEMLVDLTPTTSVAPSISATLLSASGPLTPTSTNHPHSEEQTIPLLPQVQPQPSFHSIQEWASATASTGPASFYSPPESEQNYQDLEAASEHGSQASFETASVVGSNSTISEHGVMDVDEMSESDRLSTPGGWSEIGSVVSEE